VGSMVMWSSHIET